MHDAEKIIVKLLMYESYQVIVKIEVEIQNKQKKQQKQTNKQKKNNNNNKKKSKEEDPNRFREKFNQFENKNANFCKLLEKSRSKNGKNLKQQLKVRFSKT